MRLFLLKAIAVVAVAFSAIRLQSTLHITSSCSTGAGMLLKCSITDTSAQPALVAPCPRRGDVIAKSSSVTSGCHCPPYVDAVATLPPPLPPTSRRPQPAAITHLVNGTAGVHGLLTSRKVGPPDKLEEVFLHQTNMAWDKYGMPQITSREVMMWNARVYK
jgi:hypothetical protein